MASSATQLLLAALLASLAFSPHAAGAREGRFFFSKTTRAPAAVSEAPATKNRGYGLYGRPEEYSTPTYSTSAEPAANEGGNGGRGELPPGGGRRGPGYGGNRQYGMSDTRLYQNGKYYYDVSTGKYGYGYDSNPMGTRRPGEFGSGRYGYGGYGRGNGEVFDNGVEYPNSSEENQKQEGYIP